MEAKREDEDPLKGMQQAKGYSDCDRFDAKYIFSTNGHLYGKFNKFTGEQTGPFPLANFPDHKTLTDCYHRHTGINLDDPSAAMLFQPDSPAFPEFRYYQDAAIRASFEKILKCEADADLSRVLLSLATYQTLGLDDDEGFASFLTEHYPDDYFSVIIIDECHRSAWGRWSEVLRRNPNAIHIGLTATPRQLREAKDKPTEDEEITANDHQYFGEPVYEYTLIEAQDDGYLAACEVIKRKASIDSRIFSKAEVLAAGPTNIKTGQPVTEEDLTKSEYTGKDFDDELFIDMRTPAICEDLFKLLCENGGPEQKVIIFCTREIHADRVAMQMNRELRGILDLPDPRGSVEGDQVTGNKGGIAWHGAHDA